MSLQYNWTAEDRAIIERSINQPKVNRPSGLYSVVEEMLLLGDGDYYEILAHQRCAKKFGGSVFSWVTACIHSELRDLGEL